MDMPVHIIKYYLNNTDNINILYFCICVYNFQIEYRTSCNSI